MERSSQQKTYRTIPAIGYNINDKYYIYDRFSNNIVEVNAYIYCNLDCLCVDNLSTHTNKKGMNTSDIDVQRDSFETFRKKSRCFYSSISKLKQNVFNTSIISEDSLSDKINNELTDLVLNVTESCNFRCTYCFYSNMPIDPIEYNSKKTMQFEVAKQVVDYFFSRSKKDERKFISFMGGEPLLNFSLISKIIDYISMKNANVVFSITTNGYFLKGEILKFLVENDIVITISLDGPQSIQDQNRRTKDNSNTFSIIDNNIKEIREQYSDFFKKNVFINGVYAMKDKKNIQEIFDFFNKDDYPKGFALQPAFFVKGDSDIIYRDFRSEFLKMYKLAHIAGFRDIKEIPRFFTSNDLHKKMLLFHLREASTLKEELVFSPIGLCIPGVKSLFVSTKGDFYPCSKMYYNQKMVIGDIIAGLSIVTIKKYTEEYMNQVSQVCYTCWASRLCTSCYLSIMDRSKPLGEENKYCKQIKEDYTEIIKTYIEITIRNPDAFLIYTE